VQRAGAATAADDARSAREPAACVCGELRRRRIVRARRTPDAARRAQIREHPERAAGGREQREGRRRLEVTAFDLRAQIAQTMARSVAQLELARRRVALTQRAIDLANENIKIETDRFNLGKSTNFDVLGRQEELRQAELRRTQALIDWHKAETVVLALTGDILPTFGIAVD